MLTAARFQLLSIFAALPMLMLDLAAEPGANMSPPLPVGVAEHRVLYDGAGFALRLRELTIRIARDGARGSASCAGAGRARARVASRSRLLLSIVCLYAPPRVVKVMFERSG
jgi:hypothetical protein